MSQVLQDNEEIYLEVECETEFWRRIEDTLWTQKIPWRGYSWVGLPAICNQVPQYQKEYQNVAEANGDPDDFNSMKLFDQAQGVDEASNE